VNTYRKPRLRRPHRIVLTAASIIVLLALAVGSLSYAGEQQSREVAPPNAEDVLILRNRALEFAAQNGEPNPTNLRVVAGPRLRVVEVLMGGAIVDTDQDVYVVALEGNFIGFSATRSPRSPGPLRGTHLLLVYDAETKKLWDWSLNDRPAPLHFIATPIPIDR